MTTALQQSAMPAEACDSRLPSASGVGCMDLLERPGRDAKITLDVRARRDTVMAYANNTTSHQTTGTLGTRSESSQAAPRPAGLVNCEISGRVELPSTHNTHSPLRSRQRCRLVRRHRRTARHRGAQQVGAAMKCPKCGYEIEAQQNRAAKSRWANMTKAERAAEMSRIRNKGVKNKKRTARRSNKE
jgi:hypothetical protein